MFHQTIFYNEANSRFKTKKLFRQVYFMTHKVKNKLGGKTVRFFFVHGQSGILHYIVLSLIEFSRYCQQDTCYAVFTVMNKYDKWNIGKAKWKSGFQALLPY